MRKSTHEGLNDLLKVTGPALWKRSAPANWFMLQQSLSLCVETFFFVKLDFKTQLLLIFLSSFFTLDVS